MLFKANEMKVSFIYQVFQSWLSLLNSLTINNSHPNNIRLLIKPTLSLESNMGNTRTLNAIVLYLCKQSRKVKIL